MNSIPPSANDFYSAICFPIEFLDEIIHFYALTTAFDMMIVVFPALTSIVICAGEFERFDCFLVHLFLSLLLGKFDSGYGIINSYNVISVLAE